MVGRYCSDVMPKQGGGTFQIQVNKTQSTRTWDALYTSHPLSDADCYGATFYDLTNIYRSVKHIYIIK